MVACDFDERKCRNILSSGWYARETDERGPERVSSGFFKAWGWDHYVSTVHAPPFKKQNVEEAPGQTFFFPGALSTAVAPRLRPSTLLSFSFVLAPRRGRRVASKSSWPHAEAVAGVDVYRAGWGRVR